MFDPGKLLDGGILFTRKGQWQTPGIHNLLAFRGLFVYN